jgi:hypothetical protein
VEIVRSGGLDPIVAGSSVAADGLMMNDMKTDKEVQLLEELGTQCARALRNLSVNRTFTLSSIASVYVSLPDVLSVGPPKRRTQPATRTPSCSWAPRATCRC